MRTSSRALEQLKKHEAFRDRAYRNFVGEPWTIGYGTTTIKGEPVKEGMRCTKEQALEWFREDVKKFEAIVDKAFKGIKFKQNQYDALVMFAYNNGSFAGAPTLVKTIKKNPNDEPPIRAAFLLYVKIKADKDGIDNDGDGLVDEPGEMRVLQGLVNRRNYEIDWYFGKLDNLL